MLNNIFMDTGFVIALVNELDFNPANPDSDKKKPLGVNMPWGFFFSQNI